MGKCQTMTASSEKSSREFFQSLPKIELHRHLEGTLRLSTMLEIARLHKLDLPYQDVQKFRTLVQVIEGEPQHFRNFLAKFSTLRHFYQSPEAIQRITHEAVEDAAADQIRYLELRFTPAALTSIKGFPLGETIDWVIETVEQTASRYNIQVGLIASVNRHEPVELAEEVIHLAIDHRLNGIFAIDLAGNETDFPGEEFAPIFREARQAGMKVTVHAGEWGGPERIRTAVNSLGADRIGHGIRVLEDAAITAMARDAGILFEVCPTSNYQSGVIADIRQHSLPQMIEAGLRVSINTDNPGISQIDLSSEYEVTVQGLGISLNSLKTLILNAGRASFLPEDSKINLLDMISNELDHHIPG